MQDTPSHYHEQPPEAFWSAPLTPNTAELTGAQPEEKRPARGRPFVKGHDPRRHVHSATCGHKLYQFTSDDRSKAFWTTIAVLGISIGAKLHRAGRWPGYRGRR